ncbi:MAG: Sec-independent protein translocase protein TatB [Sulfuritalea sp.]|jgi:sec-independent protein translocase protein TatB|nr:Sec-independent protein translocase protein TatB [Sulfuritalea sp.]
MFDVGLSELMVIAVVALVVIGPERLPKVARTAGLLLGRLQRYVSDVKADINREMQLDELKKLQQQVTDQVSSMEASVTHEMREIESSVDNVVQPLATDVAGAGPRSGVSVTQGEGTQGAPTPILETVPVLDAQPGQTLAPAAGEMPKS